MAIQIHRESGSLSRGQRFSMDVVLAFFYSWSVGILSGTGLYNKPKDSIHLTYKPDGRPLGRRLTINIPSTQLLEFFGTRVSFSNKKGKSVSIGMPTAEQAYAHLESRRKTSVRTMGKVLRNDVDEIMDLVKVQDDKSGRRTAVDARYHDQMRDEIRSGKAQEQLLLSVSANLALQNHLQIFIASYYELPILKSRGWLAGRMVERDTLLAKLPSPEKWNKDGRALFDRLSIAPPSDSEGFALPTPGGIGVSPDGPPGKTTQDNRDPWRLLFYMALPKYRELRYLRGKLNTYGYMGVVFERAAGSDTDRVVIDTEREGNAIRMLHGLPLEELLEIATGTKSEIDDSGHSIWKRHDKAGKWQDAIREFVA